MPSLQVLTMCLENHINLKKIAMKYSIVIIFLISLSLDLYAQIDTSLDTIKLSDMISKNVVIISEKEDLIRHFGLPSLTDDNKPFHYYKRYTHSNEKDTVFYFNVMVYPENKMSYIEKNGKVRLKYFDFEKNKNAVICTPKFELSRNLKLDELKQEYQYTDSDIGNPLPGILAPWYPNEGNDCFYSVFFSTGESENVRIELYFDCKKKLRFMAIGAYDF